MPINCLPNVFTLLCFDTLLISIFNLLSISILSDIKIDSEFTPVCLSISPSVVVISERADVLALTSPRRYTYLYDLVNDSDSWWNCSKNLSGYSLYMLVGHILSQSNSLPGAGTMLFLIQTTMYIDNLYLHTKNTYIITAIPPDFFLLFVCDFWTTTKLSTFTISRSSNLVSTHETISEVWISSFNSGMFSLGLSPHTFKCRKLIFRSDAFTSFWRPFLYRHHFEVNVASLKFWVRVYALKSTSRQ